MVDLASYHSKMSETHTHSNAGVPQSSVNSSMISTKAKKQLIKLPKKVNFFCLKPENVVEIEDLESQGVEDFDDFDIDEVNQSIQKD